MKKIFMCVNYPMYNPAMGISKKIRTQIETLQDMGYEVTYSAYTKNGAAIYTGDSKVKEKTISSLIPSKLYSSLRNGILMRLCTEHLKNSGIRYDIGFIRWNAVDRAFLNAVKQLDANCDHVLMDCHGYHVNYRGFTLKGKYTKYFTDKNAPKLPQYIDECLIEFKGDSVFGIPAMTIDTGINVDKYAPHCYKGDPDAVQMISVANEAFYHGYDRVIRGVAEYSGPRKIHLHLVGKMKENTVQLVDQLNVKDRVTLHGYQTGEALDRIYESSNIGVGPLAPHRTGGKPGTGIKTKEYFALGLPYFYAGQELLVPEDYPYVKCFPADDSPIDIEKVIEFYDSVKSDPMMRENMRDFARKNFSWEKIFTRAFALMEGK